MTTAFLRVWWAGLFYLIHISCDSYSSTPNLSHLNKMKTSFFNFPQHSSPYLYNQNEKQW